MRVVLCAQKLPDMVWPLGMCWLTYQYQCTLSQLTLSPSSKMASKEKEKQSLKLLYTPVPIVREELLVNECTDHLGQFGLTLWVVSMNQIPKNCDLLNPISMGQPNKKNVLKYICISQFLGIHGRLEFMYDQEYHYCTPKNFYFISYLVVVHPRISIYSASTSMSTTT